MILKRIIVALMLLAGMTANIYADEIAVENWDKTFGGSYEDGANSVIQTKDGSYVVAGYTYSKGNGWADAWVIRLDRDGNKIWDKTFGGSKWDEANSIIQTRDGGFIVAGRTDSKGNGKDGVWIIRLDRDGNKIWDKTFGGSKWDEANSIIQTKDGGYVVAGYTYSKGNGKDDVWIIRLDRNGNKIWDKTFGGSYEDGANSVIQTKDGGYVVAGYTESKGNGWTDAWVMRLDWDGRDAWVIRLDRNGNKLWDKTFGGSKWDEANSVIQTKDGGYVVAGYTDGDVWVIRLDRNGNKIWDKTFGGSFPDGANSIIQTKDGGYVVAGYTESKVICERDAWVIKIHIK